MKVSTLTIVYGLSCPRRLFGISTSLCESDYVRTRSQISVCFSLCPTSLLEVSPRPRHHRQSRSFFSQVTSQRPRLLPTKKALTFSEGDTATTAAPMSRIQNNLKESLSTFRHKNPTESDGVSPIGCIRVRLLLSLCANRLNPADTPHWCRSHLK